ncbi:hypothetical protein C8F01DRAFT_1127534 [Mycena amicta]|nr:hypothetical protein C8F01DRAFT_1127534 [Mycena amicta]
MLVFAPEQFALVLDHVQDPKTLKSCSLAGRILREPSQQILFHTLSLGDADSKKCQRLTKLLSELSHIHTRVKSLVLSVPQLWGHDVRWELPNPIEERDGSREMVDALAELLTHVRQCSLLPGFSSSYWEYAYWCNMPSTFRALILEFLVQQRPLLVELHLQSIQRIPIHTVLTMMTLAPEISLENSFPEIHCEQDRSLLLQQQPLRRLSLDIAKNRGGIYDVLIDPKLLPALCALETLELFVSCGMESFASSLIGAVSRTLQTVTIVYRDVVTLTIPPFPRLASATLHIPFSDLNDPAILSMLTTLLNSSNTPKLRNAHIHHDCIDERVLVTSQETAFSDLDACLFDGGRHAQTQLRLRWSTSLVISADRKKQMSQRALLKGYAEHLARLLPRAKGCPGVLEIDDDISDKEVFSWSRVESR